MKTQRIVLLLATIAVIGIALYTGIGDKHLFGLGPAFPDPPPPIPPLP